jgi:hypothetical protein
MNEDPKRAGRAELPQRSVDPREQAWDTFQRDYPALIAEHTGEWVAYRGTQRLGLAPTKTQMYQTCLGQGLHWEEFLVCCIEPAVDELYFGPVLID